MTELRPATDDDLTFCMSVGHEGLRPYVEPVSGWDQTQNETDFVSDWNTDCTWIIEHQGEKVGYIRQTDSIDGLSIDGIFIAKNWRNRGVGSNVLKNILSSSAKPVSLKVYKNNPALKLYQRLSFKVVKECELRYYMTWKPKLLNQ